MSVHPKDGGWQVRYRDGDGRQRAKGGFRLKRDAEAFDRDKKDRRRRGDLAPDASHMKMAELWDDFLELHVDGLDLTTQRRWRGRWMPSERSMARGFEPRPWHLGHKWARWPLADVNYDAIKRWHAELRRAGASDAQLWTAHDGLTTLLQFAWRRNILARNPAAQVGRPKYRPTPVLPSSIWRPADIERIRTELLDRAATTRVDRRWARERDAVLISVLAYCGLRPWDEAITLRWEHVAERTLSILDTKTGVPRSVPMIEPVVADLRAWRLRCGQPKRGLVFPRTEGASELLYHGTWSPKVWAPTLERAGLDYQRPYHLRHSCISMWVAEGLALTHVARRAGHTLPVLLNTYTHVIEEFEGRDDFEMETEVWRARGVDPGARRLRAV